MVIVTNRCFVIAEQIHYVGMQESQEENSAMLRKLRTSKAKRDKVLAKNLPLLTLYTIVIRYSPVVTSSNSRNDEKACEISTYNKQVASALFQQIVQQYREQKPDELYLDKIVETMFAGGGATSEPDEGMELL